MLNLPPPPIEMPMSDALGWFTVFIFLPMAVALVLGIVHLAQGKVEEANKDARRASELAPESSLTRQALGSVALFSGRAPEAGIWGQCRHHPWKRRPGPPGDG